MVSKVSSIYSTDFKWRVFARFPVDRKVARREGDGDHDESGGKLLHTAGDHGVRLSGLSPLDDRAEAPACHAELQR